MRTLLALAASMISSRSQGVLLAVFCVLLSNSVFAVPISITGNGAAIAGPNEVQKNFTGNVLADQGAATFTDFPVFPFSPSSPFFVTSDSAFFLRGTFGSLGEKLSAIITPHLVDPQSASENASANAVLTAEDTITVVPDATHTLGSLTTVHLSETLTGSASGTWNATLQTKLIRPNSEGTFALTFNSSYLHQIDPGGSENGDFQVVVGEVNVLDFFLRTDASLGGFVSGTLPITSSLDAFNSGHLTIDALGATIVTGSGHDYSPAAAVVPEPDTYALILTSLGLLGFMSRRKKQKAVKSRSAALTQTPLRRVSVLVL